MRHHVKIAAPVVGRGQSAITETKTLPRLRARGNFQTPIAFEGGHLDLGAKRRPPRLERGFVNQIIALDRKIRVTRQPHAQEEVTLRAAARACFALAGQPDTLAFMHAARDLDLVSFHFVGATPAQGNLAGGPVERFFQGHHDVGFHVLPALGRRRSPAKTAAEG